MVKKRKLKKLPVVILASIITLIIVIIIAVKYVQKINSIEYKFEKIGYTETEIDIIKELKDNEIETILNKEYNKIIPMLIKEEYFLFKNLDSYLEYYKENSKKELKYIVAIINVKANYEHYDADVVIKTDISKNNLLLVNKYNYLDETYIPNELTNIPLTYAFDDNQTTKEVLNAFKNMWSAAKKQELTLIINSSYRDYKSQEEIWNYYDDIKGEEYADSIAARAGYSEHQTGLALDIITYGSNKNTFEETDEFKWLEKNAHKYGFILRYPKGKEDITGYAYESWHYRYVGVDTATEIYNKNITYDEYYAYYQN